MTDRHRHKHPLRGWVVALGGDAALARIGCDVQRISGLEVGVTTEADLRAKWGEPVGVSLDSSGRVSRSPHA